MLLIEYTMDSISIYDTQFYGFLKKYIYFLIIISIIFYIYFYTTKKAKSKDSKNYIHNIFYIFMIFLIFFVIDMMKSEEKLLNNFIFILFFSVLSLYIANYVICKYYYNGFWKSLFYSILSNILVFLLFSLVIYFLIYKNGIQESDAVLIQFNYSFLNNQTFLNYSFIFFIALLYFFTITNKNSKAGKLLNKNIISFMGFIYLYFIIIYYCIKMKILNVKQIFNFGIINLALFFLLYIFVNYKILDSISKICYTKRKNLKKYEKHKSIQDLIMLFLLISIVIILMLDDNRNWSSFNYLSYLLITVFIFVSINKFSVIYPNISLLNFWASIEWIILSCYKSTDAFHSFSYMMMDNNYNLVKDKKL